MDEERLERLNESSEPIELTAEELPEYALTICCGLGCGGGIK